MDFYWIYSVARSLHCRKIVRHQKRKCQDKNIENVGVSYEAGVYKENIIKYIYYEFLRIKNMKRKFSDTGKATRKKKRAIRKGFQDQWFYHHHLIRV